MVSEIGQAVKAFAQVFLLRHPHCQPPLQGDAEVATLGTMLRPGTWQRRKTPCLHKEKSSYKASGIYSGLIGQNQVPWPLLNQPLAKRMALPSAQSPSSWGWVSFPEADGCMEQKYVSEQNWSSGRKAEEMVGSQQCPLQPLTPFYTQHLWWLVLHVNLTGPQCALTWVRHYSGVSVRLFLGEIAIWIGRLSKAGCPLWCRLLWGFNKPIRVRVFNNAWHTFSAP